MSRQHKLILKIYFRILSDMTVTDGTMQTERQFHLKLLLGCHCRSRTGKVRKRMANRNTLHSNKLDAFRKWLIKDGWTIEEPKGIWEVLRAKKAGRQNPLIVYQKMNKEHLSVLDRDIDVIKRFLQEK